MRKAAFLAALFVIFSIGAPRADMEPPEAEHPAIVEQWRNLAVRMLYLIDRRDREGPALVLEEIDSYDLHSYRLAGYLAMDGGAEADRVRAVAQRLEAQMTALRAAPDDDARVAAWSALRATLASVAEG